MSDSQGFSWVCHFCDCQQIVSGNAALDSVTLSQYHSKLGAVGLSILSITCANPECSELFVRSSINRAKRDTFNNWHVSEEVLEDYHTRPSSAYHKQPDYIPEPIRQDYYEACEISQLSPKASATLSRRCLQGMIRDYCGISRNRLFDEINDLKKALASANPPPGVQHDTIEAIDAIRKIGNIGAHMEADINVIVDVDAGEAGALIELLELLFKEWYVSRHNRQKRIENIKNIAENLGKKKGD